jgi:glycosyltransferase involved in cell wall biosynthesis
LCTHQFFFTSQREATRMGGRAVEGTGLENRRGCKLLVGSNPTPSAIPSAPGASKALGGMAIPTGSSTGRTAGEPSVSVVIPVYNRAHLVGRAISSVLAQSHQRFEIIVVDDASSDRLGAALAEIADPRLRCIAHPVNRGAAAARNTGVAAAEGEFVAFLDSDDSWHPDKLAFQLAAMHDQPPEIAGHVCAYHCIKPGYKPRLISPDWNAATFRHAILFGCTCGPGTTLLCRRAAFADVGPFDEELRRLEDWDWLLRLAAKSYWLLPSPRVLARVEVGSGGARRDVDAALRRIDERHHAAAASQGARSQRIFAASLHLERAAAAFGSGAYGSALGEVMWGLAHYPWQGIPFYRRLGQHATVAMGRKRS